MEVKFIEPAIADVLDRYPKCWARLINLSGYANSSRDRNALAVVPPIRATLGGKLCYVILLALVVAMLSGCAAIQMNRLEPPLASGSSCKNETLNAYLSGRTAGAEASSFAFLLPRAVTPTPLEGQSVLAISQAHSFEDFVQRSAASKQYLPEEIRDDAVTKAFVAMITKVSAQAQVSAAVSSGLLSADKAKVQLAAIDRYSVPSKLTHRQMKAFADKFFDHQLRPGLAAPDAARTFGNRQTNAFAKYFTAYYEGNFVDRLGQPITKPNISLTIPDSEIAAAETVLLEFLIDLFDPTPVLGDAATAAAAAKFYPGGSSKPPTAFTTVPSLANYKQIQNSGCGVTVANVQYLVDLANGASNRAAAIGGLVANTPGGLSIGLGVVGKISIGDNQTLSTMIKTAASELAARATYAAAYWSLEHLPPPLPARPGGAAPDPGGPNGYLVFPK